MHIRDLKAKWPVDDEEWFWRKPRERRDGKMEVEILNEVGPDSYCHFHCVWNGKTKSWVCEAPEYRYVEALHYGEEVSEDRSIRDLDEHFGELIRAAFGIFPEKISGSVLLHTPPAKLLKLSS